MSDCYILDDNNQPVQAEDDRAFFKWLLEKQADGEHPRISLQVARDVVEVSGRKITISTIYLGTDNNWGYSDSPLFWETMVFGLSDEEEMERYSSHEDALAGHAVF